MGYLAVLMMQRIDFTGVEHSKQVHKHMESIDIAALQLSTKSDLITCCHCENAAL